jgi:uncharacterized protein YndB with AHSA1/START domain
MKGLSFDQFTKKIYIRAPLKKLYWCWTTEEGLTSWFLKEANFSREHFTMDYGEYTKQGDTFIWNWHNWDGQEEGKVVQANGKDFIQFTFAEGLVDVSLKEVNDKTLLTLKQHNIPTDEESKLKYHVGCSNGWTFWLTNLKAYLEHGILLNETEQDLSSDELSDWVFVNI